MLLLPSLRDERLRKLLNDGEVVVLPTDTVYGLAARAQEKSAVIRLYALKGRHNKPGTVIAASIDQLASLGIKRRYLSAVEHLWPGALSVVVPTGSELGYLDQGKGSLPMRVVADPQLADLLERTGPLVTTSANLPGEDPATTVREAQGYFADQVSVYVDGGDLSGREPSTIIRIVDDAIEILRPGAVKINEKGEIEK